MASIQRRRGPNVEGGIFGILQPLADGLKLFIKELVIPGRANIFVYFLAPILIFTLSLVGWFLIPFNVENTYVSAGIKDYKTYYGFFEHEIFFFNKYLWETSLVKHITFYNSEYSILFILAISSLNVYGIILSGWASNSKYAFLGSLRSAAQMISYEVSIGLTVLPVILFSQSFNFVNIVNTQANSIWFCFPFLPCTIIFLISMLAETNRAPFDLPEAEAELVAGYNVEYAGMLFALFLLGEYSSMLLMASLGIILFFGGWTIPFSEFSNNWIWLNPLVFSLKIAIFCFFYIIVRATFPRYRYSQLMTIGWKIFLPLSLAFFFFCSCIFATMFFGIKLNQSDYIFNFVVDTNMNLQYSVTENMRTLTLADKLAILLDFYCI
jgi:NADH-quinone oxidoreductase subunit H